MASYTLKQIVNLPKKNYGIEEFKLFSEFLDEGYELYSYLGSSDSRGVLNDYFAVACPGKTLQIARFSENQAKFKFLGTLKSGQKIKRSKS